MAVVEVIGKAIATQGVLMTQLKTDFVAAGWTLVDGDLFTECTCAAAGVSIADDTFTVVGHDLANGDILQVSSSNTIPAPLTNLNPYFVVSVSGNTFKLSATQGGGAVNLSSQGVGTTTFRNYRYVFSTTGESGTKPISYVEIIRSAATLLGVYGNYYFNATTHAPLGRTAAISQSTVDTGMYYYFWGDKDFAVFSDKVSTNWYTVGAGWPTSYYSLQTALTQAETTATPKQINVDSTVGFKAGKQYQIYGIAQEGRDLLTVNTIDGATTMTVAVLPRNYGDNSIIGQLTNDFGLMYASGNSWSWNPLCPTNAAGTGDSSSIFSPTQLLPYTAVDPDARGDQAYLLQPIVVGEAASFTGWLAASVMVWIPYTSVTFEDTAGVTEADSGTASGVAGTTLTDSTKAWTIDAFIGKCIVIKAGTGAGQIRKITDNDATSVTVAAWTTNPTGATYTIVDEAYRCFYAATPAYAVREGR